MKKILSLCLILVMLISITSCCGPEETTAPIPPEETTTDTTQSCSCATTDTTDTTDTTQTTETVLPTCTETPVDSDIFVSPDDEEKTTKTIVTENDDGMKMEVIIHGYKSESLGKDFYVKNNEFICIDAVITNNSTQIYKQFLSTYCHGSHTHEIDVDITDGNGHRLTVCDVLEGCPEAIQIWEIAANGAQYGFKTKYVAGEYVWGNTEGDMLEAFTLYDSSIYTDGVCDFAGTVSFDYYPGEGGDETYKNTLTLTADVAFEVVYQGAPVEKEIAFVSPADEIKTTKTFVATNEDGLYLTFTVEGYASESLGESFYLKSNELIQASVKIMNTSTQKIYQTTAYYCHRNHGNYYAPPECAHEFDFDIRYTSVISEENLIWQPSYSFSFPLNYEDFGCYHIDKNVFWVMRPGDSFEREYLTFAAGYHTNRPSADVYTFDYHGKNKGFSFYDAEVYEDGYATFKGTVSFDYSFEDGEKEQDDHTIACDVSLKVFYVPTEN